MKEKQPNLSMPQIAKFAGIEWKQLSEAKKQQYKEKARLSLQNLGIKKTIIKGVSKRKPKKP
jgi:hypothetical protein